MKVVTIIGARPQFVKAGVVSKAIKKSNQVSNTLQIVEVIIHTGQHFDSNMSGSFLEEFSISPGYNLGIQESLHGKMTARMLEGVEAILLKEKPNLIIVYGDTNSTLAGALAASKLHIPIAHVEAGLRSYNIKMPEEINRILTDKVSSLLFCPTETAANNLKTEGIEKGFQNIFITGDVMLDAFISYHDSAAPGPAIKQMLKNVGGKYYLATIHRSENTDDAKHLISIFGALETISEKIPVVIPLHPRTAKILKSMDIHLKNIWAIDPVGYSDMIVLLKKCQGVFTDSGGLQKEAYFMNKLCITLREETEWIELVENGFNFLTGASKEKILLTENKFVSGFVDWDKKLYGDGTAGEQIVQELINFLH